MRSSKTCPGYLILILCKEPLHHCSQNNLFFFFQYILRLTKAIYILTCCDNTFNSNNPNGIGSKVLTYSDCQLQVMFSWVANHARKQLVVCYSWRHCWPALDQILFLLSGCHEPRHILVQRMTSWPESPSTAGGEERKQCLSWRWRDSFVLQHPVLKRKE